MKNLKVGRKLIVGFLIVIILTAAVGVIGIIGMVDINSGVYELYERQTVPLVDLSYAREYFQRLRSEQRNLVMASSDADWINTIQSAITEQERLFRYNIEAFGATIIDPAVQSAFNTAMAGFELYMQATADIMAGARAGLDQSELLEMMRGATSSANAAADGMSDMMQGRVAQALAVYEYSISAFNTMLIMIIVVIVVAIAAAVFLALYISGLISKPLAVLTAFMQNAAKTGDIALRDEDVVVIQKFAQNKDEIGMCIAATAEFMQEINEEMELLEKIGDGDLTLTPNILSADDKVGKALTKVVDSLNSMFGEIQSSTSQVASGSKQIADGSQSLAQGSTQQAASVQQLSSSITAIAQKTKDNADMAGRAAALANSIKASAEKGSGQMGEMMTAVKDINASSQNISKVIKSIDDIAFQTNILALNAAVEAARAGQHGKGFAVVAEEVRNLAAKSAEAAKDTESLIADSIAKAELGSRIADDTSASLTEIVTGIGESSQLIGEIARSSEEQTASIAQINTGIDQVAHVTQQNSATAEQSAAASQEMSGQSTMLEQLISQFKLKNTQSFDRLPSTAQRISPPTGGTNREQGDSDASIDFGKY